MFKSLAILLCEALARISFLITGLSRLFFCPKQGLEVAFENVFLQFRHFQR